MFRKQDLKLIGPDKNCDLNYEQSVQQVRVLLGRNKPSLSQALQEYADLRRTGADLNNTRTRSVLLERCCFDVISMGKSNDVDSIEKVSRLCRDVFLQ